jgi:hypothetical protein
VNCPHETEEKKNIVNDQFVAAPESKHRPVGRYQNLKSYANWKILPTFGLNIVQNSSIRTFDFDKR